MGYVFETEASGYGGKVKVMTGIDAEGAITGVVILSHDETPGLGANAEKPDFLNQFLQQPRRAAWRSSSTRHRARAKSRP